MEQIALYTATELCARVLETSKYIVTWTGKNISNIVRSDRNTRNIAEKLTMCLIAPGNTYCY